uniref:Uridine-cytidine kinase C isoform X2 n=1 Tax=Rhizophora mucronata TaxID=61149 RepID=A0A2P2IS22_RHIMU
MKTPKPPIAKVSIRGTVKESRFIASLILSALFWRDLSPQYSWRRLLRLSSWCTI